MIAMSISPQEQIAHWIASNDIVLFLKGTKKQPACGFSATVVRILEKLEVDFLDINVLENDAIRQGIKDYTNWPTVPQLYVRQEFIGGCDIVKQLYQDGSLKTIICA
jgi:monothiol glutaredoxin